MSSGRRLPFPTAPDLPPEFDSAPGGLESGDTWEQVEADESIEVSETIADARLREVVWTGAQLVGRRFTGLVCEDVRFHRGDLAGVVLEDCQFTRVVFESCRMSGTIFAGAILQDVQLVDCLADHTNFRMAQVRRTTAEDSNLREADFYGCSLVDVGLARCDLTSANFEKAKPERLDLRGSTVDGLLGVGSLSGTWIGSDQMAPLGAALIGSLEFRID